MSGRRLHPPAGPHKAALGLWAGLKLNAPVTWSLHRFRLARVNIAAHLVGEFAPTRQPPAKGFGKSVLPWELIPLSPALSVSPSVAGKRFAARKAAR